MPLSSIQTTIIRSTPASMKTYLAATRSAVSSARPCVIRFFNELWWLFQGPRSTLQANVLGMAHQGAVQCKLPLCVGPCPVQCPQVGSLGYVVCYWLCSSSTSRLTLRREDYGRNFKAKRYVYNSSVATNITSHPAYSYNCPIQSTHQATCTHLPSLICHPHPSRSANREGLLLLTWYKVSQLT